MNSKSVLSLVAVGVCLSFIPELGLASVESSLSNIQSVLLGRIFPVLGAIGLVWAGFSFVAGNPNARSHLILAMVGAAVAFGSQSIINLIRSIVN